MTSEADKFVGDGFLETPHDDKGKDHDPEPDGNTQNGNFMDHCGKRIRSRFAYLLRYKKRKVQEILIIVLI